MLKKIIHQSTIAAGFKFRDCWNADSRGIGQIVLRKFAVFAKHANRRLRSGQAPCNVCREGFLASTEPGHGMIEALDVVQPLDALYKQ